MSVIEASIFKPGRPKDASKGEEIVAAATELFMENGYELTSMEAVAKRASVSKLTIYSHFADKNELFRAIVQQRCDRLGMPRSFIDEALLPPREALVKIGSRAAKLIFRPDSIRLMRIIQAEASRHPEMVRTYYEAGPSRVKAAFIELLQEFNRQGQLTIPDPPLATNQFFSLLKGEALMRVLMLMSEPPTASELDLHVQSTVVFFLQAYHAHPTANGL